MLFLLLSNDEIGKLMYDFSCTNPDEMNYEVLTQKARYFKQDEKGVATMCKLMEYMRNEAAREAELRSSRETAERLINKGKMTLEEIADTADFGCGLNYLSDDIVSAGIMNM